MTTGLTVLVVIASVLICIIAIFGYGFFRVCLDARASALTQAGECIDRHFAGLNVLLDDPETPDELAEYAVFVSKSTADPVKAERVLAIVAGYVPMPNPTNDAEEAMADMMNEVHQLSKTRPDLFSAFQDVVYGGTFGGGFRHVAISVSPLRVFKEMRLLTRTKAKSALFLESALRAFGVAPHDVRVVGPPPMVRVAGL